MTHFGVAEIGNIDDNLTEKATENAADATKIFVGNDMADNRRSFLDKSGFVESAGKILKCV